MNNTMYINSMTRFCNNLIKAYGIKDNRTDAVSFGDKLAEKDAENGKVTGTANTGMISTKNMTMEQYRQYIYDKISDLPMHPSNMQDSISVQISDAGFEAMKNDPEYEQWALKSLKTNFQFPDPWSDICGGKFCIFYFGATKEECRGESWRMGYRHGNGKALFDKKAKDSFWERRRKRRKEMLKLLDELEEKKAIAKREARTQYYAQMPAGNAGNAQPVQPGDYDRLAMQIFASYEVNTMLNLLRIRGSVN